MKSSNYRVQNHEIFDVILCSNIRVSALNRRKTALQQHLVCQEWPNEGLKISSFRRLNSCIYAARNLEIEDIFGS